MSAQKQIWTLIHSNKPIITETLIEFNDQEFHYATRVLRLKENDPVIVNNCHGVKAQGIIQTVDKKSLHVLIQDVKNEPMIFPKISLVLGQPKQNTLENIISSCSEIGVSEIHAFRADKTQIKSPLKQEKLQKISNESVRISKSAYSAKVFVHENLVSTIEFIKKNYTNYLLLFCNEEILPNKEDRASSLSEISFKIRSSHYENVFILVGPEGSFSLHERNLLMDQESIKSISLGKNVLRTETACTVACGFFNNSY